jgi:hypothetical protein
MFTITPLRRASMCRPMSWASPNTAVRFVSIRSCRCSALSSSAGLRDSGVDQDVDLAVTADSGSHQRLAVRGAAHVAGHRQRVHQPRSQLEVCLMSAEGEDDSAS